VEPNNTVNNPNGYTASVNRALTTEDSSVRIDYQMGERDIFYARYQITDFLAATEELVRGTNAKQDNRSQSQGLTWTHVFSPSTTGEFRFGFGRRRVIVGLADGDFVPIVQFGITFAPSQLGSASQYPLKRHQNDFQYVYNVAIQRSRHTLKFGADTRRSQLNDQIQNYHRGWWTFSATGQGNALDNFTRGIVQTYQQGFGPSLNGYRSTEVNLYAQDTWRVTPRLTLDLGLRYEYVGRPGEVNNLVDLGYGSDGFLEPRFGFAYSPFNRTVIRGGLGLFHGRVFQSIFSQVGAAARFNPPSGASITRQDPDMSVAAPLGAFQFAPGFPLAQVAYTIADPGLRMPYTEQWNLTLERELPWKTALSVSYVANRGIGFLQYDAPNRAQFPTTSTVPASYTGQTFSGVLFDRIDPNLFNTNPAPGFISLVQPRTNQRRRDGRFASILRATNNAWSYYHSMQTSFTKHAAEGLAFQVGYTWSKNIDTGSEATFVGTGDTNIPISETQSARAMRALSRLDQPHRFVLSWTYQFPFFKGQPGALGRILGGWEFNGIATLGAGNPFSVILGYDLNGDGIGSDRPFLANPAFHGASFDNARINPATGRQFSMDAVPTEAFFPDGATAATRAWPYFPGTGLVASAGRNIFRIQGQNNFDVAFVKNTKVFGRDRGHELQFRAEMFNFFNRVQFGFPSNGLVDTGVTGYRINPLFGRITGLNNSPRSMLMMLRYRF
ncbi:MAG: hypothetical protein ACRD96_02750, partial [Bryobacteraceae bacterium]